MWVYFFYFNAELSNYVSVLRILQIMLVFAFAIGESKPNFRSHQLSLSYQYLICTIQVIQLLFLVKIKNHCFFRCIRQWEGQRRGGVLVLLAWKGVRRVANFLLQFFVLLFSSTIYIRFFDILVAQNKNHFYNRLILKEVINFLKKFILRPSG